MAKRDELLIENKELRAKLQAAEARIAELESTPIKCIWCNLRMATVDEAAAHVVECAKSPNHPLTELLRLTESRAEAAEAQVQEWKDERQRCFDAWKQVDLESGKWRRLAIHNGKRLEAIRALVSTEHESLPNFISRVRSCLYQDHFPDVQA